MILESLVFFGSYVRKSCLQVVLFFCLQHLETLGVEMNCYYLRSTSQGYIWPACYCSSWFPVHNFARHLLIVVRMGNLLAAIFFCLQQLDRLEDEVSC